MLPTNNLKNFLEHNDRELRCIISSICSRNNFTGAVNDVVQDVYFRFLTSDIVKNYDPNFSKDGGSNSKMSTYLYPILNNFVKTIKKDPEYRIEQNRYTPPPDMETPADMDDVEIALRFNSVASGYQNVIDQGGIPDGTETLAEELRDFERKFPESEGNKKYTLSKRKDKGVKTDGCTLMDVYGHLKDGMSGREIAGMYGITDMFVSELKTDVGNALREHGVSWSPRSSDKVARLEKSLRTKLVMWRKNMEKVRRFYTRMEKRIDGGL